MPPRSDATVRSSASAPAPSTLCRVSALHQSKAWASWDCCHAWNICRVAAVAREQLGVRPDLDQVPVLHDRDPVGAHRSVEPVCDEDGGAAFEQHVERALHQRLGREVEARGGFVENEHTRRREERPRERDELPFARRQRDAPLVAGSVEPVRQRLDQLEDADRLARREHVLARGLGPCELDVVADAAGEQERLLRHDPELTPQRVEGDVGDVVAVDEHAAAERVVEPRQQLGDRRLARAGGTDQRERLALPRS